MDDIWVDLEYQGRRSKVRVSRSKHNMRLYWLVSLNHLHSVLEQSMLLAHADRTIHTLLWQDVKTASEYNFILGVILKE